MNWYRRIDGQGNVGKQVYMNPDDASGKGLMPKGLEFDVVVDGSDECLKAIKASPEHQYEMLMARQVLNQAVLDDKDARIAELTAEAAKYKDALNDIQARVASGYFVDANHLGDIARNAMKDGV